MYIFLILSLLTLILILQETSDQQYIIYGCHYKLRPDHTPVVHFGSFLQCGIYALWLTGRNILSHMVSALVLFFRYLFIFPLVVFMRQK